MNCSLIYLKTSVTILKKKLTLAFRWAAYQLSIPFGIILNTFQKQPCFLVHCGGDQKIWIKVILRLLIVSYTNLYEKVIISQGYNFILPLVLLMKRWTGIIMGSSIQLMIRLV